MHHESSIAKSHHRTLLRSHILTCDDFSEAADLYLRRSTNGTWLWDIKSKRWEQGFVTRAVRGLRLMAKKNRIRTLVVRCHHEEGVVLGSLLVVALRKCLPVRVVRT